MTESKTPICDLIERILSRDLSHGTLGQALEAARPVEAALARGSRSTEEKREIERLRKADYRSRIAKLSHGTKKPAYILKEDSNSQTQLKKESKKESVVPNVPGTNDDWPPDFLEIFWKQYPPGRKTGKKAVAVKLGKIRKTGEVTFSRLMLGVSRYAGSNPDPQYTKAPEVWLNKGCWDDEHVRRNETDRNGNSKVGFSGLAARLRRNIAAKNDVGPSPVGSDAYDIEPGDRHRDTTPGVERMETIFRR